MLGHVTETIFACWSLKDLREVEDFVLNNIEEFGPYAITCVYTMLHVRNQQLKNDNIVRELIYKDE